MIRHIYDAIINCTNSLFLFLLILLLILIFPTGIIIIQLWLFVVFFFFNIWVFLNFFPPHSVELIDTDIILRILVYSSIVYIYILNNKGLARNSISTHFIRCKFKAKPIFKSGHKIKHELFELVGNHFTNTELHRNTK